MHLIDSNKTGRRARVLFLVDRPNWAFDFSARALMEQANARFDIEIGYVDQRPRIRPERVDLAYLFFWGETYHQRFGFDPRMVVKEISSHRWLYEDAYRCPTNEEAAFRYLLDAGQWIVTSRRLLDDFRGMAPSCVHTPNGFDPRLFYPGAERGGPMVIGFAGNARDPGKGFPILREACLGQPYQLREAGGGVPRTGMGDFYRGLDIFACSSSYEGEPLTLIEAMACGCFPVCTDVGIVSELVRSGENGLIVEDRSPQAFRRALDWCGEHLDLVRKAGRRNAEWMKEHRTWRSTSNTFMSVFDTACARITGPLWRNDDVGPDTNLDDFRRFCDSFYRRGFTQIQAVTLRGLVGSSHSYRGQQVEYPNQPSVGVLPNARIRELSQPFRVEDCAPLVDYLGAGPDELALHGLYHTDYSVAPADEQEREIREGLEVMRQLWPGKPVKRFVPPFNRFNIHTWRICRNLGLELMTPYGVHLEEAVHRATPPLANGSYRYHHHRFYPTSTFGYYDLSLSRLDAYLARVAMLGGCPEEGPMVESVAARPRPHGILQRLSPYIGRTAVKRRVSGAAKRLMTSMDRVASRVRGGPGPLARPALEQIVRAAGAESWFLYALEAGRNERWDIRLTREWIARARRRTDRILELGCGAGLNLHWLARKGFRRLEGWDLSPSALRAAREVANRTGFRCELSQRDILAYSALQGPYDAILSLIVTYLNDGFDLSRFVGFYAANLAPGGVLIFDCIDKEYDLLPGNQYHTADSHLPEYLRRRTEYKVRYSEEDVHGVAAGYGLRVAVALTGSVPVPRKVFVLENPKNAVPANRASGLPCTEAGK